MWLWKLVVEGLKYLANYTLKVWCMILCRLGNGNLRKKKVKMKILER